MQRLLAILCLALLGAPTTAQQARFTPELKTTLTDQNFAAWRDHIRVAEDEDRWTRLPWHMSFAAGLKAAAKAKKPLLLWVMNGHPFGCT